MSMCSAGHRFRGRHCPICTRKGPSRPELGTYRWQKLAKKIRARDNNQCRICGTTQRLSVHHIQRGGPDTYDNLITLCSRCHHHAERNAANIEIQDLSKPIRNPRGKSVSGTEVRELRSRHRGPKG